MLVHTVDSHFSCRRNWTQAEVGDGWRTVRNGC